MRIKISLTIFSIFILIFNTQASVFIPHPESINSTLSVSNSTYFDTLAKKDKKYKKEKKRKNEKEKIDRFAKWGFISGLTGLICFFIFPIFALVLIPLGFCLSIAGLNKTRKSKSTRKGLSIAGLVIGSVGILFLIFGFILALTVLFSLS
jgi:hypothetical protein